MKRMSRDLGKTIKDMLFWYSRENKIIFLPFHSFFLFLWIILCKLLPKNRIINRDEKVIAFTSIYFNGNARAVYECMLKKFGDKYTCFWIARNMTTFHHLKISGKPVVYMYFPFTSLRLLFNTSVLVTNDSYLHFLFPREPKMIQLWHGEGGKGSNKPDIPGIQCVPSQYIKRRYIELWGIDSKKLYVTGYARMDFLYKYLRTPKEKLAKELGIDGRKKVILYAPTFDLNLWTWGDEYKGLKSLCEFCKQKDLILIIRPHPLAKFSRWKLKKLIGKFDNIHLFDTSREPDTMKLLAVADVLITAWSSIDNEYFLTKRPIIYLERDKEYFAKERGKMKIPLEFRAGEIVHNNEEFYKVLDVILKEGNRYKRKQEKILKIIHGSVDGKASKKVVKVIEKLSGD